MSPPSPTTSVLSKLSESHRNTVRRRFTIADLSYYTGVSKTHLVELERANVIPTARRDKYDGHARIYNLDEIVVVSAIVIRLRTEGRLSELIRQGLQVLNVED